MFKLFQSYVTYVYGLLHSETIKAPKFSKTIFWNFYLDYTTVFKIENVCNMIVIQKPSIPFSSNFLCAIQKNFFPFL